MTPEAMLGYQAPLRRDGTLEHALKIVRSWHADLSELKSGLPRLSGIPTLVVWGAKDRAVDPASAVPLIQSLGKGAQLAVIEGAGHLPFDETPEKFIGIVSHFFAGQAVGADSLSAGGNGTL